MVPETRPSFDDWRTECKLRSPQFQFWSIALDLELAALVYVKSIRQADFNLYIDSMSALIPWFLSFNHTHYGRWLSVHIKDMASLHITHPDVAEKFQAGLITLNKTSRTFLKIAIDQAHEQNNATVKGTGGAIGLTQNEDLLQRWSVGGPELARLISEFQASLNTTENKGTSHAHHDETPAAQKRLKEACLSISKSPRKPWQPIPRQRIPSVPH